MTKSQKHFTYGSYIMKTYVNNEYEIFMQTDNGKFLLVENGFLTDVSDLAVEIIAEGDVTWNRDEIVVATAKLLRART